MICVASATFAAALAVGQAQATGVGLCVVTDGLSTEPARLTYWMASSNGVEVATALRAGRAILGTRWADLWWESHPAPEPVSLPEAVEALGPGLLVVAWR